MKNLDEPNASRGEFYYPSSRSHDEDIEQACSDLRGLLLQGGYTDGFGASGQGKAWKNAMQCLRNLVELHAVAEGAFQEAHYAAMDQASELGNAKMKLLGLKNEGNFWRFSDICDEILEELVPRSQFRVLSDDAAKTLVSTLIKVVDGQRGFERQSDEMEFLTKTLEAQCDETNQFRFGKLLLESGNPAFDSICRLEEFFNLPLPHASKPFDPKAFRQAMEDIHSLDVETAFKGYLWARENLLSKRLDAGSGPFLEFARTMVICIDPPWAETLTALMNVSHFLAALEKIYMGWTPGKPFLSENGKSDLLSQLKSSSHPSLTSLHDRLL